MMGFIRALQAERRLQNPEVAKLSQVAGRSQMADSPHLGQTLEGSFSAVLKPNFASKYSMELGSI